MTAILTTTLKCQRSPDPCPATWVADGWPKDVRRHAGKAGWSSTPGPDGKTEDRCPAHPKGSDVPEPTLFDHLPATVGSPPS